MRTNEMTWWVSWVEDDDGDMFASKLVVEGPTKTSCVNTAGKLRSRWHELCAYSYKVREWGFGRTMIRMNHLACKQQGHGIVMGPRGEARDRDRCCVTRRQIHQNTDATASVTTRTSTFGSGQYELFDLLYYAATV